MKRSVLAALFLAAIFQCPAEAQSPTTLKAVVDWNGVNQQWTANSSSPTTGYGLLIPNRLRSDSTLQKGAYYNNGSDVFFMAMRSGPISFRGNIWYVTGIDPTVGNITATARIWKNGAPGQCNGDSSPVVFGIGNGMGSVFDNAGVPWVFTISLFGEDAWANYGDVYRVCLSAPIVGGSAFVDGLHSMLSFTEEP